MRKGRFSRSLSLCQTCACRSHSSIHLDSFVHCHDVVKVELDLYLCDGFAHVNTSFQQGTENANCRSKGSDSQFHMQANRAAFRTAEKWRPSPKRMHLRWILDLSPSFCCTFTSSAFTTRLYHPPTHTTSPSPRLSSSARSTTVYDT